VRRNRLSEYVGKIREYAVYKFLHDEANKMVHRYLAEPTVIERTTGKNKNRIGWDVILEVETTRADNKLVGHRWEKPRGELLRQSLDGHYTRDQVIRYFFMHHEPDGVEISQDEYERLQLLYEAEARAR
jgi:hypothetical protein